jgi:F-type H+-transporting ATPase subunit epsilon
MNTFRLKITSPEGDLFCDSVVKLSVRAAEGDLAVMAGHIPFVTALKSGEEIPGAAIVRTKRLEVK